MSDTSTAPDQETFTKNFPDPMEIKPPGTGQDPIARPPPTEQPASTGLPQKSLPGIQKLPFVQQQPQLPWTHPGYTGISDTPPVDQNWQRFFWAISGPESSHNPRNTNPRSGASGLLQDLPSTRAYIMRHGWGDPWAGGMENQFQVNRRWIEHDYPQAAAAIARGDYQTAVNMLRRVWPSLPGGSQNMPGMTAQFLRSLQSGVPQKYFGNPYDTPVSGYGRPDYILKTAQSNPGYGMPGYMPQPQEVNQVLMSAMRGLMNTGSGRISPLTVGMLKFWANYLAAQRQGQVELARIRREQRDDALEEILRKHQDELRAESDCLAAAQDPTNPNAGDLNALKQCLGQIPFATADVNGDKPLQSALNSANPFGAMSALLGNRHEYWLNGSKAHATATQQKKDEKEQETQKERHDWLDPDPDPPATAAPATPPTSPTAASVQPQSQAPQTPPPPVPQKSSEEQPTMPPAVQVAAATTSDVPASGTTAPPAPKGNAAPGDATVAPDGSFQVPPELGNLPNGTVKYFTDPATGKTTKYTVQDGRMVPEPSTATPTQPPAATQKPQARGGVQPVPSLPALSTDASSQYRRPQRSNSKLEAAVQDYVAGNTGIVDQLLPKDPAIRSRFGQRVLEVEQQLEAVSNSQLTGQDALDATLRIAPQFGQRLAGYISGRTAPPHGWLANKPPYELMIPIGQRIDPTFSEQVFQSRAQAIHDFGIGRDAQQLTAYGTALLHSQALRKLLPSKPEGFGTGIPKVISLQNYLLSNYAPHGMFGQAALSAYNESVNFLAPEVAKAAMSGNKPFEGDIKEMRGELSANQNTEQVTASLDVIDQRLAAKALELKQRWLAMTGRPLTDLVKLFDQDDPYGYGDYQGTTHAQRVGAIAASLGIK